MRSTWNVGRPAGGFRPTATIAIVAAHVAGLVLTFFFSGAVANPVYTNLSYSEDLSKPWTLFTYPFAPIIASVFWFAIGCWILYQFLSDLERRLGNWGGALFYFAMVFLGGLGYFVGTVVAGARSAYLPHFDLPLEVVVFTWCVVNYSSQIMLFAVIPVPSRVLMWLCVAAVVVQHGWGAPIVGAFAALPLLGAWLYATDRVPGMRFGAVPSIAEAKQEKKKDDDFGRFMTDVKKREVEREEKERLRRLFEDSLEDGDKEESDG